MSKEGRQKAIALKVAHFNKNLIYPTLIYKTK